MAAFFRRLARTAPIALSSGFGAKKSKSSHNRNFQLPFTAFAAISGGASFFYYFSSPNLVHLEQKKEDESRDIALNPDKWIEFKLQDTARVSHNTQLFRFSFDPTKKLGLDVASCIITRAPLGQDSDGKQKYVIRPYVFLLRP